MAHLLAPLLFGVGARGAGKCVHGGSGPGREGGEPDAQPAGADVGVGRQPPGHKDKLPNRPTTAWRHRRWYEAQLQSNSHELPAFGRGGGATWARSRCPRTRAYPGQVEGPKGTERASLPWVPALLAAQAAARYSLCT